MPKAQTKQETDIFGSPENNYPIVDFNQPIFSVIAADLAKKGLIKPSADFSYSWDLRICLYQNFNLYLELLLAQLEPDLSQIYRAELNGARSAEAAFAVLRALGLSETAVLDKFSALAKAK